MSGLIENLVSDKKIAAKLSLSLIAVAEGMSLFSVFFARRANLCGNIVFNILLFIVSDILLIMFSVFYNYLLTITQL